MGASQQQFSRTPVAVASATVMSLRAPAAAATESASAPAADDTDAAELAEFLQPKIPKRAKRKSSYDVPDAYKRLVGERMRQVREASGMNMTDAAIALGYSQPVQLSVMENGERLPTARVLTQWSAAFGTTTDYLLGLTSDPESDPATVIQRRLAAEVGEEFRLVLAKVTSTTVDLARDVRPVVSRALRLATAAMEARAALAKVRALNETFDDECRGGSSLVARLEAAAELAVELLESTTGLQAKARGGLVGAALVQASLDEGVTIQAVREMLASGEAVSPSAIAARAAAVMGDDAEGEPDDAS